MQLIRFRTKKKKDSEGDNLQTQEVVEESTVGDNHKQNPNPHFERELFVIALLVFGASFSNIVSQQDAVHFALTWSLVTKHSVWLNGTLYAGEPYVTQIGTLTLSALPPGLAFFGAAFTLPALVFVPMEASVVAAYLATYSSCVFGALASVLFFKAAKMFGSTKSAMLLALVFTFGTSMWIYSRVYLPEGLATALGIASVFCLLRIRLGNKEKRAVEYITDIRPNVLLAFASGILLGLAVFVDNMAIFFTVPIFLYLVLGHDSAGKINKLATLSAFVAGSIGGGLLLEYYDLVTTGSVFTAPYGLPLLGGVQASAYSLNLLQGLYQAILSPQSGLLIFTPFVIIPIIGFVYLLREGTNRSESFLFLGLFLSILVPFSLQDPSTYPHNTIGPSELIIVVPYVLLPGMVALDRLGAYGFGRIAAYLFAGVSIAINGIIALTDPVILGSNFINNNGAGPLATNNIPLFLDQSYLTWWSFFEHPQFYASTVLFFPIVVFLIYSFNKQKITFRGLDPRRFLGLLRYRRDSEKLRN